MSKKKDKKRTTAEVTPLEDVSDSLSKILSDLSDIRHDADTIEVARMSIEKIEERLTTLIESNLLDSERYIIYEKEKEIPVLRGVSDFLRADKI